MGLVRASLKNPCAVVVMALAIIVIGVTSVQKMPLDILPQFKTPAVQILTLYPGMPTELMERDITNRLERWTSQSMGIAYQESRSMVGVSVVRDYFREDIDPNTADGRGTVDYSGAAAVGHAHRENRGGHRRGRKGGSGNHS